MLYTVVPVDRSPRCVYLPKGFSLRHERDPQTLSRLSAGLRSCDVEITASSDLAHDVIEVSADVLQSLHLPPRVSFQVKCEEDTLVLGPVIGLLMDYQKRDLTQSNLRDYQTYTLLYEHTGGLLCVFSSEGMDIDGRMVEGFFWRPGDAERDAGWEKATLPFPQAIFRRVFIPGSTIRNIQDITGHRMFNTHYFDKWKFWNMASQYETLQAHLPDTALLKTLSDVDDMFARHGDLAYLKPVSGSLGNGLIRVEKKHDQYLFREKDRKAPVLVLDREEASKHIERIREDAYYIVQQAVDLLRFENRYSDFRVMMQKDETACWQCTGIVVSMGASGGICSNYSDGSAWYMSFGRFLSTYVSFTREQVFQIRESIVGLCKTVCRMLDREMGNYGDVGLDIGLDKSFKPWVFEVNERHYHSMPKLIYEYQTFMAVKSNPVKYATTLCGFCLQ